MSSLTSVLIPCRNGERWLAQAVQSALAQEPARVEVIVVDDSSTDASREVARSFRDPRVKAVESPGHGASAARNVAFRLSQGDRIQYLDADDLLAPGKIFVQSAALDETGPRAICSGAWARFVDDPAQAIFTPEPVWRDFEPHRFLVASWLGGGMMPVFAWLTPRTLVEEAGPWNETLTVNDDGEFFTRVLLRSSRVVFRGDARGYYRSGIRGNLSGRRDDAALASAFSACEMTCAGLLEHDASREARQACATAYQRFVYDAFPAVPSLVARAEARAAELGGSDLPPPGGPRFHMLARWLGWKSARRLINAARLAPFSFRRPPPSPPASS